MPEKKVHNDLHLLERMLVRAASFIGKQDRTDTRISLGNPLMPSLRSSLSSSVEKMEQVLKLAAAATDVTIYDGINQKNQ